MPLGHGFNGHAAACQQQATLPVHGATPTVHGATPTVHGAKGTQLLATLTVHGATPTVYAATLPVHGATLTMHGGKQTRLSATLQVLAYICRVPEGHGCQPLQSPFKQPTEAWLPARSFAVLVKLPRRFR